MPGSAPLFDISRIIFIFAPMPPLAMLAVSFCIWRKLSVKRFTSCSFVPEHAGRVPGRIDAGCRVQVGVADPTRSQPDEHLAVLRLGEIELLDDERLAELLEHCRTDLHRVEANPSARSRDSGRAVRRR